MYPVLMEWLNVFARWIHVIAGIMWVGNSMLFNWLDRNLLSGDSLEPNKFGHTWLLHSGGFYRVEKYISSELPPVLHWFKWQSYTTWLTGFLLLVVVYYSDGGSFLIPANHSVLTPGQALALGLAVVFGGFFVYDLVWRAPFVKKHDLIFGALSIAALFVGIYALHQVFTGRSAYLHVGAMLGTFMAGNVFFHIIPSQKQMTQAIAEGKGFDMDLSNRAKQRSIHNNYFTFPLIFTMISNHFGGLYGHEWNWLILIVLMVTSALVRHFLNIRFDFKHWRAGVGGTLAAAALVLMVILNPHGAGAQPAGVGEEGGAPVTFAEARAIIQQHCLSCHSKWPTDKVLSLATGGVHYDTPEEIVAMADRIYFRAVETKTMPFNNMGTITDEERETLGRWIKQGAKLE
ncbi:MAG: urate hydroxylase PuuD [Kiritimatiellae bacterium]|nr:urate hydroxylase PuuD [Kiritimatiellia bacterium]